MSQGSLGIALGRPLAIGQRQSLNDSPFAHHAASEKKHLRPYARPLKRRLTLDVTARVLGIDTSKLRNAVAVAEEGRGGAGTFAISARSTPRKRRRASSMPNCGQIPPTDVLLRGGVDGIRALSADQEAWPGPHRGGTLAQPGETWRSGEDEPTRCGSLPEFPGRGSRYCLSLNLGKEKARRWAGPSPACQSLSRTRRPHKRHRLSQAARWRSELVS